MSVRAYRLISKKVANNSSFNIWHDDELMDFFKKVPSVGGIENWSEQFTEDGNGTVQVSIYALHKALKDFKWEKDDYRPKAIRADIAFAKKHKDHVVLYECY